MYINVVIDTNVFVSGVYTKNLNSPTCMIVDMVYTDRIISIYNKYIIKEYVDVLYKEKFSINENDIVRLMQGIVQNGCEINPKMSNIKMIDETDRKFYDAYSMIKGCYLVTGNIKHYPKEKNIVTPREFVKYLYGKY